MSMFERQGLHHNDSCGFVGNSAAALRENSAVGASSSCHCGDGCKSEKTGTPLIIGICPPLSVQRMSPFAARGRKLAGSTSCSARYSALTVRIALDFQTIRAVLATLRAI